jgi:hypothetical protein
MRPHRPARLLLVWAIDAVAFWLLAAVLPGVDIDTLVPADWEPPSEPIVGAEAMHEHMHGWVRAEQTRIVAEVAP